MWMMYVESRYSALYVSSTLTMVKAGGKQRTVVAVACMFNCHEDRVADALWRPVYCSRVRPRDTTSFQRAFALQSQRISAPSFGSMHRSHTDVLHACNLPSCSKSGNRSLCFRDHVTSTAAQHSVLNLIIIAGDDAPAVVPKHTGTIH